MKEQQTFEVVEEMVSRIESLTREEMRKLVELEMKLSDKGYNIESHEDLWLKM